MTLELGYSNSCRRLASTFSKFVSLIQEIKVEFESGQVNDPQLTLRIIESRLQLVQTYEDKFLNYSNKINSNWSLTKYINYAVTNMNSFFRVFDNPFISVKQYSEVLNLLDALSSETRQLENLSINEP